METDATYRGTVYPWQCDHDPEIAVVFQPARAFVAQQRAANLA